MSTSTVSKHNSLFIKCLILIVILIALGTASYFGFQETQRGTAKTLQAEQKMLETWPIVEHSCINNAGGREDVLNVQYKYSTEYDLLLKSLELKNGRRVLEYQREDMSPAWKCRIEWHSR